MEYEAKKLGRINTGEVYQVAAPLDEQIKAFRAKKISYPFLAYPDEVAQIRLSSISNDHSRTSMTAVSLKKARTILLREPLLMNDITASEATRANTNAQYLMRGKVLYEVAEARAKSEEGLAPEDRTACIISQEGDFDLTPEMPDSRFIIRSQTSDYFAEKTNGRITFFCLPGQSKNKTTLNYLWFGSPRNKSYIECGNGDLCDGIRAFGLLRYIEGNTQRFNLSYTK
ncbi:MAG: hypothetical protein AABX73_03940 [Nanoarchaeota archaeon]